MFNWLSLLQAHYYSRKADRLVAKEKYEEAILCHGEAAGKVNGLSLTTYYNTYTHGTTLHDIDLNKWNESVFVSLFRALERGLVNDTEWTGKATYLWCDILMKTGVTPFQQSAVCFYWDMPLTRVVLTAGIWQDFFYICWHIK